MPYLSTFCLILLLLLPVTLGTVDYAQQTTDCENGGNNIDHYREQFKQNSYRYGVQFDDFCITEDLETSKCCTPQSSGAIITAFKIYEINSPSGTESKHIQWALLGSEKSDDRVSLSQTCLEFDWKKVIENLTFGKVELTMQYPNDTIRTNVYISDIHSTSYSVWVPPPPLDIEVNNSSLSVSLEETALKKLQYRNWQLCICTQDGPHFQCELDPPSLYDSSTGWTKPLDKFKSDEIEVCVGFSYSSYVGTFGPNRTCEKIAVDRRALALESPLSAGGKDSDQLGFYLRIGVIVIGTTIFSVTLGIISGMWIYRKLFSHDDRPRRSRVNLCRETAAAPVDISEESSVDESIGTIPNNQYEYIDDNSVREWNRTGIRNNQYDYIDDNRVKEWNRTGVQPDTQLLTDSGMSSGLSNAQNEGLMYQGVNADVRLPVAIPPNMEDDASCFYQSGQSVPQTEQEYSSGVSLHQNISSSQPEVCEVIP